MTSFSIVLPEPTLISGVLQIANETWPMFSGSRPPNWKSCKPNKLRIMHLNYYREQQVTKLLTGQSSHWWGLVTGSTLLGTLVIMSLVNSGSFKRNRNFKIPFWFWSIRTGIPVLISAGNSGSAVPFQGMPGPNI